MPEKAKYMPPIKQDNTLPPDFDGIFRFTNFTDREFTAKWDKVAYTFAPMSTSPMVIARATPEEVQYIRKKFARELAEREFHLSGKFNALDAQAPAGSGKVPAIYTDGDLEPYIQKCLTPLPVAYAAAKALPKDSAENYRKEPDGTPITVPIDKNTSLLKGGSAVVG